VIDRVDYPPEEGPERAKFAPSLFGDTTT